MSANEYKDYILGVIFYKYLSDRLVAFATAEGFSDEEFSAVTEDDTETVDHFKSNLGYFIAHKHLFSTWLDQASDFTVGEVRKALSDFSLIHPNHKHLTLKNLSACIQAQVCKKTNSGFLKLARLCLVCCTPRKPRSNQFSRGSEDAA